MKDIQKRYSEIKRRLFDKYYSDLNPRQREAVFSVRGPLLVLAGAGSGKTTVLVRRIAHIIKYGDAYSDESIPRGLTEERLLELEAALDKTKEEIEPILEGFAKDPCRPYGMLAITFTNKAANEIKTRLSALLSENEAKQVWAGTFHSVCMRILRVYTLEAGLSSNFTIFDADDSRNLCKNIMKRMNIDGDVIDVKSVLRKISAAKDRLLTPDEYMNEAGLGYEEKMAGLIYREYQDELRKSNAVDFDDIIFRTLMLLKNYPEIRKKYQDKFFFVNVDEYQDTNGAQFLLTSVLSEGHNNLMVVGDDDQSIYKFRGATIENILNFDTTYPNAKVVRLEQNYRSTSNILNAANGIISNNSERHEKSLWTDKESGKPVTVRYVADQEDEARYIISTINRHIKEGGFKYGDFAILYRNNAQSRPIETAFAKSAVPYRILGNSRFFDRTEVRDILSYLYVIRNPDGDERLKRIINMPRRQIGQTTVNEISRLAFNHGISMFGIIKKAKEFAELSKAAPRLRAFAELIDELSKLSESLPPDEFMEAVIEKTGYERMVRGFADKEIVEEKINNLKELVSGVKEYMKKTETPTLGGYLEDISLVTDIDRYDEKADATVLMTVHSAKGLEFPVVFLPGMEEGVFPNTFGGYDADTEEERRLAYVAVTRAKKELYITHCAMRILWGRTEMNRVSRFVLEMPTAYVKFESYARESEKIRKNRFDRDGFGEFRTERKTVRHLDRNIKCGDLVTHEIFGKGEVLDVREIGTDIMYEIAFEECGTKKIMGSYVKLDLVKRSSEDT